MAARLGFGGTVPSDVPATFGTLELPDGDLGFARAAAGFVGSRLSPFGAAHLATTIATLGRSVRLKVVESASGHEAPRRRDHEGHVLAESTARELVHMMEYTTHSGTSLDTFRDDSGASLLGDIRVAGKTGTLKEAGESTTSWFIGFAPSRNPRIVVSVLLENGPTWRQKANQVGRDLLRAYFAARGARGVTMPAGL